MRRGYDAAMFDWSDLRIFLTVARKGSFTAAARELRMDQTTVGRRVSALETSLGSKLFRRGRDGLALSAAGREVLALGRPMEDAAHALSLGLDARDHAPAGTVRMTTVESFAGRFLAERIAGLRRAYPEISIELSASNQMLSLTRREADLAIRLARPEQPGLVAKKIGTIGYGLYASRAYLKTHPGTDLEEHDVLGYDEELDAIPEAKWLAARRHRPFVLRSNSLATLETAAASGAGVTVLPCYVASTRKELVRMLGPEPVVTRDLWLVIHAELADQARVRAVADYVTKEVHRERALLAGTA